MPPLPRPYAPPFSPFLSIFSPLIPMPFIFHAHFYAAMPPLRFSTPPCCFFAIFHFADAADDTPFRC